MASRGLYIIESPGSLEFDLVLGKNTYSTSGRPDNESSRSNRRAGRHECAGRNQRLLSDDGSIEHDRADSDQGSLVDFAAVDDRAMAHRDLVPQQRRKAASGHMKRGVVLDIGPCADPNSLDIAPQHRGVENARIGTDFDVPDHGGPRRDPDALVQSRLDLPVGAKDRACSSINRLGGSRLAQASSASDPSYCRSAKRTVWI